MSEVKRPRRLTVADAEYVERHRYIHGDGKLERVCWDSEVRELEKAYIELRDKELAALQTQLAAMRKLIAKFGQGTFTLRHALTADEIQLMAECVDMKVQIPEGRGVDLSNPRTVFGPTPQSEKGELKHE